MPNESVALLGDLSAERHLLGLLAKEFGWSLENSGNLPQLRDLNARGNVVAVFIEAKTLGVSWREAVRSVLSAAPKARLIVCRRFSDQIPWPELAAAGVFHELLLPFAPCEVRQSLGFVCAAGRRGPTNLITWPEHSSADPMASRKHSLAASA